MEKEIEEIRLIALSLSLSGHHIHADKLLEIVARLEKAAQQNVQPTLHGWPRCSKCGELLAYHRHFRPCSG